MSKKKIAKQQVVIPKGFIQPGEAAVIEIPRRYQKLPVVVVKKRTGEFAQARASSYFIPAREDRSARRVRTVDAGHDVMYPACLNDRRDDLNTAYFNDRRDALHAAFIDDGEDIDNAFSQKRQYTRREILDHLQRSDTRHAVPFGGMDFYAQPQMQVMPQTSFRVNQSGMSIPPQHQVMSNSAFAPFPPGMGVYPQPQVQVMPQPAFAATQAAPAPCQAMPQPTFEVIQIELPASQPQSSASSGGYCEPRSQQTKGCSTPQVLSTRCPGELSSAERTEKQELNKTLEDYQKARRRFLENTTVLTGKLSRTSMSSCESCG